MYLSKSELDSFTNSILNTYEFSAFNINFQKAKEAIENELLDDLESLNLEKTMNIRQEKFQSGNPLDYMERVLTFEGDKKLICGIRHKGLNPDLPYVNCIPNFVVENSKTAYEIAEFVRPWFEVFSPELFCFHSRKKMENSLIGSIYMVSSTDSYNELQAGPDESDIELSQIKNNEFYEWYKCHYDNFHEDNPALSFDVSVNPKEVMQTSMEQGLLFYLFFKGERIGLIAGESSDFLGLPGLYFNEILITKKWKGQGFAKSAQRKFVLENKKDYKIVWGTIDEKNKPSYKTAARNNRRPVRYECFLRLN